MNGRAELDSRKEELLALCREHKVAKLYVFGSAVREDFDPARSDFDFLVEFLPGARKPWATEYLDLKEDLQRLFRRPVDVGSPYAIKNPYILASVKADQELLYAA
jgi:uncharacterized protein